MRIEAETVMQIGVLLYGHNWRKGLSRDIGVSYYTLNRWARIGVNLKDVYAERLIKVCEERRAKIERVRVMLVLR